LPSIACAESRRAPAEVRTRRKRRSTTGLPYEYPAIEEMFAPRALATIGIWLDTRFNARIVSGL